MGALLIGACLMVTACGDQESRKTAYFDRGSALFDAGDDARARLEFNNTLQIDNRYAEAWYMLGRVEQRSGEFQKAYRHYSRAVELAPELVDARVGKAQILLLANELELATEEIEAVLAIAPQNVDGLVARGALQWRQGDAAGAAADARAALAIEPNNAAAAALLASIRLDEDAFVEVVTILRDAIAANPELPDLRLLLGRMYERQGNSAGVVDVLQGLVEQHPEDAEYRFRLASYLVKLERIDEAEVVLREAVAISPTDLERQRALLEFLLGARGVAAAQTELQGMLTRQADALPLRLLEVELHRAAGDEASAEAALRQIQRDVPPGSQGAIQASSILAQLLIDTDREADAADLIATVLKQSPTEPDFLQLRAALALKNNDPALAIADLRTVLDGFPDRAEAYRLLGLAHWQREEYALAQDALEKSVRLAPSEPRGYLELAELRASLGDNQGALAILEQLLAREPEDDRAQERIAKIQLSVQDWDALAASAERILMERPNHPLGYYLKGIVLQQRDNHGAAVQSFQRALELKKDAIEPALALARSQLALGVLDQARQTVARVLAGNPNNLAALTMLGEIQLAAGDGESAEAILEEAVRFHPTSTRAYVRLTQLQFDRGDWDAASKTLEQGIEATGRNGYLVLQKALLLDEIGEHDAAIQAYEELLARFPDALVVVNNLAVLLADQVDDPAALERALELAERLKDSDVPEFLDTLGWIYYRRGEYVLALSHLEKAVAGQPEQPEMRYHLGLIYAKLGRLEEAKKNLWLAAAADGFPFAAEARGELDKLNEQPL